MTIQTLEPHLIDSLRQSAREILETMVFLSPKAIDAATEECSSFGDQVIGLLGFTGTRSGTFVVRTDEGMAKTIAANAPATGAGRQPVQVMPVGAPALPPPPRACRPGPAT